MQCDAEYRTFIYYSSTQILSLTAPVLTDNEISNCGRYVYKKELKELLLFEEIVILSYVEPERWKYMGRLFMGIYQSCKLCTLNSQ